MYKREQIPVDQYKEYDRQTSQVCSQRPINSSAGGMNNQPYQQDSSFDKDKAPGGRFFSLKIHGAKAAIEFKNDRTRAGFNTIRIEAANILNPHAKTFDWNNRITIQVTKTDLLGFIKAFLLFPENFKLAHYGAQNDKSAEFKYQCNPKYGKKIFAQISQKGHPLVGIPIPIDDATMVAHMALAQYINNFPNLTPDSVIKTLEMQYMR